MEPLLSVRSLSLSFSQGKKRRQVTDRVSFDVYPGEIVSLVGESGCGKSVTALSLLGLLPRQGRVENGRILFDGRDLLSLSEKELDQVRGRDISMVFQDIMYSLNPVFTIQSQMTEGMRKHLGLRQDEAVKEAEALLARMGLPDPHATLRKFPHQLSGGQRQRVMIAMALSCRPRLLIADEPTTALDVTIQLQIMQLLRSLRDETGMAILLITHDLGVVAETADRVVVMYAGQCIESADTRTLLQSPYHAYTQALLSAVPGLSGTQRLYAIPGAVPDRYDDLVGCRFYARCPYAGQAQCRYSEMQELAPGHMSRCRAEGGAFRA